MCHPKVKLVPVSGGRKGRSNRESGMERERERGDPRSRQYPVQIATRQGSKRDRGVPLRVLENNIG